MGARPSEAKKKGAVVQRKRHVPDLLHQAPSERIDVKSLEDGLSFAFVSGDSNRVIEKAFTGMKVGASVWNPDAYQHELFLDELIKRCMYVEYDGFIAPLNRSFLERVIASPPVERADIELRRDAITELWEDEEARGRLQSAYRRLCQIIRLFDTHGLSSRYDDLERRLEIIRLIRDLVLEMAAAPRARTEGVERIRRFGLWVKDGESFKNLVDFLAYEEKLATVELSMQIGVDGRIREFNVLKVEENKQNRYYQGPVLRLLSRIWLYLRGFRFNETEIIERWIDKVFTGALEFVPLCLQLKADMELYLATLAFRDYCEARGLSVCLPDFIAGEPGSGEVRLEQMFNPLLFSQEIIPVCCDVKTEGGDSMLVITGPNSGGKTRLLQAVSVIQLLGQVGIYVPAESATLRYASGMFVSLVEGVKVDQEEGRLGSEMLRIRRLFEQSTDVSLVIIDELCSGTNPSEGEEIFYLVMSLLQELEPLVMITTHFLEFAKRLQSSNGLSLEFLQVELNEDNRPTFGFIEGVAETSLARQTAARLGVTREELMSLIERKRNPETE